MIGIFFLSCSALFFEITLTRLFSLSQWYHFAFMVVSIALLGIGASGTFLMAFPSIRDKRGVLSVTSLLASVSILFSYTIANRLPFNLPEVIWDYRKLLYILLYYSLFSIPFFFYGLTVAVAISRYTNLVHRIYFSDLTGASLGAILPMLLFNFMGGEEGIIFSSMLAGLSSIIFAIGKQRGKPELYEPLKLSLRGAKRQSNPITERLLRLWLAMTRQGILLSVLWINLLIYIMFASPSLLEIKISPYKGLITALKYPNSVLLESRWNPLSRIDIIDSPAVHFAPGMSLKYQEPLPPQLGITVDGDNLNAITHYEGKRDSLKFTSYLTSALPYYLAAPKNILILEPGGGLEILSSIYHDAKNIEVLESNPLIIDLLYKYTGSGRYLYYREGITIKIGDVRGHLYKSKKAFDIIQLSLLDNQGASSTGLYSLSEEYRLTVEAFIDYYKALKDGGFLSITRYLLPPPRQEIRIAVLALSALEEMGIEEPEKHIAAIRSWGTITILLKKGRIGDEDIKKIKEFCQERRFDLVYYPGIKPEETNIYNKFQEPVYEDLFTRIADKNQREGLFKEYLFDIRPVTDDAPFFYQFFKFNKIKEVYKSVREKWPIFIEGGYLVPVIFIQALLMAFVLIILPLFLRSREPIRKSSILALGYFLFIALGFMFIEISFIQKFILLLGHPVYAVSTVLGGILISSGAGSLLSGRLVNWRKNILKYVLPILCLIIILYFITLPFVVYPLLKLNLLARIITGILILAPLGLLMGMPFPAGIRWLEERAGGLIPWAWAVNGCTSVLASTLAMMLALSIGFTGVILLAAIAYLLALIAISINHF